MATVNTVVNYVTNPSFETSTAGVLVGPGATVAVDSPGSSGASALKITGTTPALVESSSWVGEAVYTAAQVGEQVAFQASVSGDVGLFGRLVLEFRDGATVLFSDTGDRFPLTDTLTAHGHTGTVPEGTDNTRIVLYVSASLAGDPPPSGWVARTDAWMVTRDGAVEGTSLAALDAAWAGESMAAFDAHWDGKSINAFDTNPLDRS